MEENKSQTNIIDDLEFITQSLEDKIRERHGSQVDCYHQSSSMSMYEILVLVFQSNN